MDIEQLISLREAAVILGYTPQSLRFYLKDGRLPIAIEKNGQKLFDINIIKNWKAVPKKMGRRPKNAD